MINLNSAHVHEMKKAGIQWKSWQSAVEHVVVMHVSRCAMEKLADSFGADRCNDKKGSFMVETTAWEGKPAATALVTTATHPGHQETTHWHDGNKTDYSA